MEQQARSWYGKWYKILLVIPIILLLLSLIYLGFFFSKHKDIMLRDVSLSGGTTITLKGDINSDKLESVLKEKFSDISFRKLTDINTGKLIATIIESSAKPGVLKENIELFLGYKLTDENSNIEFSGPTLSQSFYQELIKVVFLAFILMALVIFLIFGESSRVKAIALALSLSAVKLTFPAKLSLAVLIILIGAGALLFSFIKSKEKKQYTYPLIASLIFIVILIFPVYYFIFVIAAILFATYFVQSLPSIAVIFAAFSDIVLALAAVNLMGIKLSTAGIAAFLMLIGYSVDTNILLTTRALKKKEGTLNERIFSAFKTGVFMTCTALAAVIPIFFLLKGLPNTFRQIFLILALGLSADILNTWLTNTGIIKWYCEKRGIE